MQCDTEHVGRKIQFYRQKNGYSRQYLSENICDESTLYRIEKGLQLPRIDILQKFCFKLNIPINFILCNNEEKVTNYINKMKKLCRESLYQQDFQIMEYYVENAIEFHKRHAPFETHAFKQYIGWLEGILVHKIDRHPEKAEEIFRKLLFNNKIINELDINIANSLALVLIDLGKYDDAFQYLRTAVNAFEKASFIEEKALYPRIAYTLAFIYYHFNKIDESINICFKIKYFLQVNFLIYMAGEVNHLLGILYKKKGELDCSQKYFKQAIDIFSFEERHTQCVQSIYNLGNVYFLKKEFTKGREQLQLALKKISELSETKDIEIFKKQIKHTEQQYANAKTYN